MLRTRIRAIGSMFAICAVFSVAALAGNRKVAPSSAVDQESYAVYSAVLPHLWPWAELDAHHLVILDQTVAVAECLSLNGKAESAQSIADLGSAVAQYRQVNQRTWRLRRGFQISRSYSLIGPGELAGIRRGAIGAWDLFFEQHADSGGWVQFSAVGFDAGHTTAVLYASYHCGRTCGGGAFYVLHKSAAGKWSVARTKPGSCGDVPVDRQMTGL